MHNARAAAGLLAETHEHVGALEVLEPLPGQALTSFGPRHVTVRWPDGGGRRYESLPVKRHHVLRRRVVRIRFERRAGLHGTLDCIAIAA